VRRYAATTFLLALAAAMAWPQLLTAQPKADADKPAAAAGTATKDSPIVAATRKKLANKVSVDFKDTPLKEVVETLKTQVEDLSIWIDGTSGVSQNQAMTFKADDMALADVLDGMFKKADLHYDIGTPSDGRYAGWVIIRKGKATAEAPPATTEKPPAGGTPTTGGTPTPPPPPPATTTPTVDPEQEAATKLSFAKQLIDDGKTDKAKMRLADIVQMFPNTKAAAEAKELLEKLNQ
jgi:TolA-binding protein